MAVSLYSRGRLDVIYLTGDTHGEFERVAEFCGRMITKTEDVMVILGDAGFNYHLNRMDNLGKKFANEQPITWFCIKGNHEKYAGAIESYEEIDAFGGTVYVETEYPNILFAKDGEVYTFEIESVVKKVLVIGGAYSIDKQYRLAYGHNWFEDEQPSFTVKKLVEDKIEEIGGEIDYVFSHTCPMRYEPREWFLSSYSQDDIDKTTELWLDSIYDKIDTDRWYCGHYHGEKLIDNVRFMFENYVVLGQ